jgi:YggT family protein
MNAVGNLILRVIDLYTWVVIAMAIMSWLIAFNVVNMHNRVVAVIADVLYRLTEPALRPIRNVLPNLGGIDISPVILILLLLFLRELIGGLPFFQPAAEPVVMQP